MFNILESTESLHTWLDMNLFTDETKTRVMDADILLIPDIGKIEGIEKAFKPDTKTFYKFALSHKPSQVKIEILENEGEINILNFHSHEIWLPNLYIKDPSFLPLVMELVNDFSSEKQKHLGEDVVVNFQLRIQNQNETCMLISFKGNIGNLNESISELDMKC